jgi:hypothetical protein
MTDDKLALRKRLESTQGSVPGSTSDLLDDDTGVLLGYDNDIRGAVVHWARTGEYLSTPIVDGATPASLANMGLIPTMVFSTLAGLRTDSDRTRAMMRQHFGKLPGDDPSRLLRMKPKSERQRRP